MTSFCPHTVTVGAFLVGSLGVQENEDFHRHVKVCPDCQSELTELLPVVRLLVETRAAADRERSDQTGGS